MVSKLSECTTIDIAQQSNDSSDGFADSESDNGTEPSALVTVVIAIVRSECESVVDGTYGVYRTSSSVSIRPDY